MPDSYSRNDFFAPIAVIQPPWPSPPKRTLLGRRWMARAGGKWTISIPQRYRVCAKQVHS